MKCIFMEEESSWPFLGTCFWVIYDRILNQTALC